MLWVLIIAGALLVGAAGAYVFAPTIKSLLGPDFEPAPKDDASVENAIADRMVDGGQGM